MEAYIKTDQLLHLLCQSIAKASRCFVPAKDDDSHNNLYFDSLGNRIIGRWFDSPNGQILLALNFDNQYFELVNNEQRVVTSVSTVSFTIAEVEAKIQEALTQIGLDASAYQIPLHYEIPEYEFSEKPIPEISHEDLTTWSDFRKLANDACNRLLGHTQTAGEVRIWPHHFDTGIYTIVNEKIGIGFGLAMKDNEVDSPYFYMTGYAQQGSIDYQGMPEKGPLNWTISDNLKGAIIPLESLTKARLEEKQATLNGCIITAYEWFMRVIS